MGYARRSFRRRPGPRRRLQTTRLRTRRALRRTRSYLNTRILRSRRAVRRRGAFTRFRKRNLRTGQEAMRRRRGLGTKYARAVGKVDQKYLFRRRLRYHKFYDGEPRVLTQAFNGYLSPFAYALTNTISGFQNLTNLVGDVAMPLTGFLNAPNTSGVFLNTLGIQSLVFDPYKINGGEDILETKTRAFVKKAKHQIRVNWLATSATPLTQAELKDKNIFIRVLVVCSGTRPLDINVGELARTPNSFNDDPNLGALSAVTHPCFVFSRYLSNFADCTSPLKYDRKAIDVQSGMYIVYDRIMCLQQSKNYVDTFEFETYPNYDSGYAVAEVSQSFYAGEHGFRHYYLYMTAIGQPDEFLTVSTASATLQTNTPMNVQVATTYYCNMLAGVDTVPTSDWKPMGTESHTSIQVFSK